MLQIPRTFTARLTQELWDFCVAARDNRTDPNIRTNQICPLAELGRRHAPAGFRITDAGFGSVGFRRENGHDLLWYGVNATGITTAFDNNRPFPGERDVVFTINTVGVLEPHEVV